MPRHKSVHTIFEQFVSSLSDLIKRKVSEAVNAATTDFLTEKFGVAKQAADEPKPKRRYRRRRGRKPAVEAVAKPAKVTRKRRKRGAAKVEKPVRLSKNGKRIGRPPKAAVEVKHAE